MISSLDLRHIIEMAFLPKRCACTIAADGSMTIEIFHQNTSLPELTVSGIDSSGLTAGRAIAALVLGLREELRLKHLKAGRAAEHRRA